MFVGFPRLSKPRSEASSILLNDERATPPSKAGYFTLSVFVPEFARLNSAAPNSTAQSSVSAQVLGFFMHNIKDI